MLTAFSLDWLLRRSRANRQHPRRKCCHSDDFFLLFGIAGLAWPGMIVAYCVETVPFDIHVKGLANFYGCKSIASIFNQYGECLSLLSEVEAYS